MSMIEGWVEENEDRQGEKEVVMMVMMKKYVLSSAEVH